MLTELFGPLSIYPAVCTVFIAFLAIYLLGKIRKFELPNTKFKTIDSLRGYLAIIVFISHGSTWYYYLRTNDWKAPPNNLYAETVQASIAMFFMITAFLLCNKLYEKNINWTKLYVGRLVRLLPLYLLAVGILFFIVGLLSDFKFNIDQSWLTLASQLKKWSMFTLYNDPDINGINDTWRIVCKVTWTLRYEWVFYFNLPIISIILFKNRSDFLLAFISVLINIYIWNNLQFSYLLFAPFVGGIVASILSHEKRLTLFATHWIGSISILFLICLLVFLYSLSILSTYNLSSLFILAVIFILITHGNTVYGLLSAPIARQLGQLSYGIYLFHGILFFALFKFILGFNVAANLENTEYWLVMFLLIFILVIFSFVLHIFVEAPFLKYTIPITSRIKDIIVFSKHQLVVRWNKILHLKSH